MIQNKPKPPLAPALQTAGLTSNTIIKGREQERIRKDFSGKCSALPEIYVDARNSFQWDKRLCEVLSANFRHYQGSDWLTTDDYKFATLKHWPNSGQPFVIPVVSMARSGSPDGTIMARKFGMIILARMFLAFVSNPIY
jgi:hypothetical protein